MSSLNPFSSDRRRRRNVRISLRPKDRPPMEQPADAVDLRCGDGGDVAGVVAMPEGGLIVLCTQQPRSLYTFTLNGDGEPLCASSPQAGRDEKKYTIHRMGTDSSSPMAVLGGDLLAMVSDGILSTWRASSLELLETYGDGGTGEGLAAVSIASMGAGKFVVGTDDGGLVFFSHCDGQDIIEVARGINGRHLMRIVSIAACDNVVVTGSIDRTAAVWNAITLERVAVLNQPGYGLCCVSVCERFVATGLSGISIRSTSTVLPVLSACSITRMDTR